MCDRSMTLEPTKCFLIGKVYVRVIGKVSNVYMCEQVYSTQIHIQSHPRTFGTALVKQINHI